MPCLSDISINNNDNNNNNNYNNNNYNNNSIKNNFSPLTVLMTS